MTAFIDQLYQNGGAPVGGMFTNGKAFFVDPYRGGDSNRGTEVYHPKDSVKSALSAARDSHNDVIYLISHSNTLATTADYITSTLTWNKDSTHLIGINAGNHMFQRSTIRPASTATAASVAPLVTISANNCRFENISFVNDLNAAAAVGAVYISGNRNHFKSCHFGGNAGGSTADVATQYSLKLVGAQENLFEDCTIGIDTITRTNQRYEMYFDKDASGNGTARNVFRNCTIITYSGAAAMTWLTTPASSMDRWNYFDQCQFINPVASGATTMSQGFSITNSGSPNGLIAMRKCAFIGVTASETVASQALYYDGSGTSKDVYTAL
jgi:hypothetical protein